MLVAGLWRPGHKSRQSGGRPDAADRAGIDDPQLVWIKRDCEAVAADDRGSGETHALS